MPPRHNDPTDAAATTPPPRLSSRSGDARTVIKPHIPSKWPRKQRLAAGHSGVHLHFLAAAAAACPSVLAGSSLATRHTPGSDKASLHYNWFISACGPFLTPFLFLRSFRCRSHKRCRRTRPPLSADACDVDSSYLFWSGRVRRCALLSGLDLPAFGTPAQLTV